MNNEIKEKILFVDDDENILDVASEFFQLKGYRVVTAKNGLEALKILEDEKFDCCFTDINMPEMDGIELAERIRVRDNSIPVIIMTGYPSLDNTIRTLKNGVVDFLIKPINLNQMELCIERVLRERQLFVENILLKKEVESNRRLEKLNQELQYKVDELHILNKIMTDFTNIGTKSDVFQRIIDMTIEITPADESRFYVINEEVQSPFEVTTSFADQKYQALNSSNNIKAAKATSLGVGNNGDGKRGYEKLIMEIVSDGLPLLVSENKGSRGLSREIRSFMVTPLTIREKVFGVLTAAIIEGNTRFTEKDLYYLSVIAQNAAHAIENIALYENIYDNLFATLYAFVKAIEARDPYTQQHSNRVTIIANLVGKEIGCIPEELDILNFAGRLHDIGKTGVRDDILLKPGRLTDEEFAKIKEHPVIGAGIVGHLACGRENS